MFVCLCRAVSSRTVVKVIGRGASTVGAIGMACKAGTACGRCHPTLQAMLDDLGGSGTDSSDTRIGGP